MAATPLVTSACRSPFGRLLKSFRFDLACIAVKSRSMDSNCCSKITVSISLGSLHEFASLECRYVHCVESEPLAILSLFIKSLVPIRFYACRVVRSDDVHCFQFLRELNAKLV